MAMAARTRGTSRLVAALFLCCSCLLVSPIGALASGGASPSHDDQASDLWTADQDDAIGFARTTRAHPPHAAASQLSPSAFLELILPQAQPAPPVPHLLVVAASAAFFLIVYLFSGAIHSYLTDDLAAGIAMQHVELAMQRDLAQQRAAASDHRTPATDDDQEGKYPHPDSLRHRSAPLIQVIPAVGRESKSSPSLLRAYLHAYGVASAANLPTSLIEWNSRLVSNVHAFISVTLGLVCFFASSSRVDPSLLGDSSQASVDSTAASSVERRPSSLPLFNPFSSHFTPSLLAFNEEYLRDFSLMVTCGYLAYDLALCLWVRFRFRHTRRADGRRGAVAIDDGLTLVHHVLIIFAFSCGVRWHVGTYLMSCFLLNEISTFGLNANFWLAAMGWKGGLYKLNGVLLFAVFIVARVLFNLYVVGVMALTWTRLHVIWIRLDRWPFLLRDDIPLPGDVLAQCALLTALACGHVGINLLWFGALTKAVRRKIGRTDDRRDAQAKKAR